MSSQKIVGSKKNSSKWLNFLFSRMIVLIAGTAIAFSLFSTSPARAATAKEIDVSVDVALERFHKEVHGSEDLLKKSKGVLTFPKVYKAGFGIGGEYGEGSLRIKGKTVDYYSTAAASIGFQLGAQVKTVILVFMNAEALKGFRSSDGWEAGVDGSVALITLGMGDSLDTTNVKDPILGFVLGQKGLMYNLTLEGSKFSKLDRSK